jgi:hypothetical protein
VRLIRERSVAGSDVGHEGYPSTGTQAWHDTCSVAGVPEARLIDMTLMLFLLGCAFEPPMVPDLPPSHVVVPDAPEAAEPAEPMEHDTDRTEEPPETKPESAPSPPVEAEIVPIVPSQSALPKHNGTGLLAAAGFAGAVGIGFNVWRAYSYAGLCAVEGELERALGCTFGAVGIFPMTAMAWMSNLSSIGLAATGGAVRGRYDGIESIRKGRPGKPGVAAIASGAAMVGLGVAAGVGLRLWMSDDSPCEGADAVETCLRRRTYGYFAGLQLSAMTTAAGAGLLAYGVGVRKYWRRPVATIRVSPEIGWAHAGLSLAGTF